MYEVFDIKDIENWTEQTRKKRIIEGDRTWFFDIEQNTVEWDHLRKGIMTASTAKVFLVSRGVDTQTGIGKGAMTHAMTKASQRRFNIIEESYTNQFMERGKELEQFAFHEYQKITNRELTTCGFVRWDHPELLSGCSPDGLDMKNKTGVEIKCKNATAHFQYLIEPEQLYKDHAEQVQFSMFVTGWEQWDIVHYHPQFKGHELVIFHARKNKGIHDTFAEKLPLYNNYIESLINKIS